MSKVSVCIIHLPLEVTHTCMTKRSNRNLCFVTSQEDLSVLLLNNKNFFVLRTSWYSEASKMSLQQCIFTPSKGKSDTPHSNCENYFLALENRRQRYFSPLTVISNAPSWLSKLDAVPISILFSFSRFSLSNFNRASCFTISACTRTSWSSSLE